MVPPPFAAKADVGSNAAITMHKTKRMTHLRFRFFTLTFTDATLGRITPHASRKRAYVEGSSGLWPHPPSNKLAHLLQRLPSLRQLRIPHRPSVDHVWPDLQCDVDIGKASRTCKAHGIVEQRLGRPDLDEHGRKTAQVGKQRRDQRVLAVNRFGRIAICQFLEIDLMDQ